MKKEWFEVGKNKVGDVAVCRLGIYGVITGRKKDGTYVGFPLTGRHKTWSSKHPKPSNIFEIPPRLLRNTQVDKLYTILSSLKPL